MKKNHGNKCCEKYISDGFHFRECRRIVKGTPVCGIHLAAERKRDDNCKKYIEGQKKFDDFSNKIKRFAKIHGLKTLSAKYESLRFVVIDFAELVEVLDAKESD